MRKHGTRACKCIEACGIKVSASSSSHPKYMSLFDDRCCDRHVFFGAAARGELLGRGSGVERLACAWSSGRRPKTPCSTPLA